MGILYNSRHLEQIFEPDMLLETVDNIELLIRLIEKKRGEIDALAFSGNSGGGMCYPLSYKFGRKLIYVRKKDEHSHGYSVEASRQIPQFKSSKFK